MFVDTLLGFACTFLELHILPNPPETYGEVWTQMEYIYLKDLRGHIRRLEHGFRCFLLFLATELLTSKDGQERAAALLQRPDRAPPRKRPYDPLELVQEERLPKPRSFSALPSFPTGKTKTSRRLRPFEPYDWGEVSAAKEINRLTALTLAIAHAEAHALLLASRLLAGEFYLSSDEVDSPKISGFDNCQRLSADTRVGGYPCYDPSAWPAAAFQHEVQPSLDLPDERGWRRAQTYRVDHPHFPPFFRRLEDWFVSDDLLENVPDEARKCLTELHLSGCRALYTCP
mgnify:FL=1